MDWRDIKEFTKDMIKYCGIALIVLLLVLYVISLQQVIGPSMNPNYQEGDILLLNKIQYRLFKPKRFEVVAVESKQTKYFIKRVIGLPGETVEYKNNVLYINGTEVKESFKRYTSTPDFALETLGVQVIPEGKYLVVGDNRGNSLDSRYPEVGLIDLKDFTGKVMFRLWPFRK